MALLTLKRQNKWNIHQVSNTVMKENIMKNKLLKITLLSTLGSASTLAAPSPEQYLYQVAFFNGENLIFRHSSFTFADNQFSDGKDIPYLIKECEKQGSKTIDASTVKQFYQGVTYKIDMQTAQLSFIETVLDESTYTKPKKIEIDECMNTGEPQEKKYKYNTKFDLTKHGVQRFTFGNNRIAEVVVQREE